MTAVAIDAAGARSAPVSRRFTTLKPRRQSDRPPATLLDRIGAQPRSPLHEPAKQTRPMYPHVNQFETRRQRLERGLDWIRDRPSPNLLPSRPNDRPANKRNGPTQENDT